MVKVERKFFMRKIAFMFLGQPNIGEIEYKGKLYTPDITIVFEYEYYKAYERIVVDEDNDRPDFACKYNENLGFSLIYYGNNLDKDVHCEIIPAYAILNSVNDEFENISIEDAKQILIDNKDVFSWEMFPSTFWIDETESFQPTHLK